MRASGKSHLLMPLELVERGADYDLARYRKIEELGQAIYLARVISHG